MTELRAFLLILLATVACPAAATPCPVNPLLAMTYNIRLDTPADGANSWVHRRHLFIGQIASLRPALLGLQEVLLNQKHDLEVALPDYSFVGGGRDDGKEAGEFSPLAINKTIFRIGATGMFWLSPTPDRPSMGWDAAYRRVATWAHLTRRSDGVRLLMVNSHWDNQGIVARQQGGALILGWIRHNRLAGERLVVFGDFNADNDEESVAQLLRGPPDKAMLRDSRQIAEQPVFGPAFSFNAFDAIATNGQLIDHIFVGPGISVRNQGVIAQHENGRVASDHFPVVAVIDIRGKRSGKIGSCR
jgi:endonuclease/exonuclease/phosphatase family metal-dependent hydrolase